MALLGKLEFTILHPTTGLPVSGATVQVRKQGATVQGTTGPETITVHTPGGFTTSPASTSVKDADDATELAITAVAAGSITVAAPGFSGLTNDVTRISVKTPTPTLYNAEDAAETISGATLTTDANGFASGYAVAGVQYDARVSGAGLTAYLLKDIPCVGGGRLSTNIFPSGAGTSAWDFDTERALSGTDLIARFLNASVLKASVRQDGLVTCVGLTSSAAVTISAGGISITGGLTLVSGALSLPDGSIAGADLAANAVSVTQADDDTADYTITASYVAIPGVSVTTGTLVATDEVIITAVVPVENSSAAASRMQARLFDDGTIIHETATHTGGTATGDGNVATLIARRTGLTGAHVYTVQVKQDAGAPVIKNTTDRKARIIVVVHKK